jgi:hypothetical protein
MLLQTLNLNLSHSIPELVAQGMQCNATSTNGDPVISISSSKASAAPHEPYESDSDTEPESDDKVLIACGLIKPRAPIPVAPFATHGHNRTGRPLQVVNAVGPHMFWNFSSDTNYFIQVSLHNQGPNSTVNSRKRPLVAGSFDTEDRDGKRRHISK